ncbi:hypothetical protein [Deinococcus sedimenti]|uniref:hypothetical protein n=1 Tax=Deinococcus sedimenti TaxID=1867090 RepID=UPI00166E9ED0|nr:hypothetical protein [Deinococcus sedimenti]
MTAHHPDPADYARLQDLTARYSRYSASALGLGHLYGAVTIPLTYLLARADLNAPALMLWAAAVSAGFVTLVRLTRRQYQTLGAVTEQTRSQRGFAWGLLAGAAAGTLLALLAERTGLIGSAFPALAPLTVPSGLALLLALTGTVRLTGRSDTRTVGLGLLLLCGALVAGHTDFTEGWRVTAQWFVITALSLGLIRLGWTQHTQARRVATDLRDLRARLNLSPLQ